MQGKIIGKRSIRRRQNSWLKNLREWFGCSNHQLFRSAISNAKIALLIGAETSPKEEVSGMKNQKTWQSETKKTMSSSSST